MYNYIAESTYIFTAPRDDTIENIWKPYEMPIFVSICGIRASTKTCHKDRLLVHQGQRPPHTNTAVLRGTGIVTQLNKQHFSRLYKDVLKPVVRDLLYCLILRPRYCHSRSKGKCCCRLRLRGSGKLRWDPKPKRFLWERSWKSKPSKSQNPSWSV